MDSPARPGLTSLPAQPGPLIGREAELELTLELLDREDVRLLTLVGAAGTGKTRLGVAVAEQIAERFSDTYFVDLAPVTDRALLLTAIAQAMNIREEPSRALLEVLEHHLSSRRVLLLLDNFEQLLAAAPQLSELLQLCPPLTLLVTSRSALRLSWEHVVPVPPLAVPSLASLPDTETLAQIAAVTLFVQRAQRVDPYFRLTPKNAQAIASICVRLDGLPLAIELAAARTRVLPPEALLSRLAHRLDVLAVANQDQPARQRTLRAALDWSYELLSPPTQALFRRLSVFVGGFPLGAVAEVRDPDGALGADPMEAVQSLVHKRLVGLARGAAEGQEPRFGMLETIREYALERLAESGERDQVRRQHAAYFLMGADVPLAQMRISQQSVWLESLEAELENLRAALAWCQDVREPELGLSAAGLLSWFWVVRGYVTEGRRQLTGLLALASPAPSPLRAGALGTIGLLALHQADYARARALFEESLAIRRSLGDPTGLLSPLSNLGAVAMQEGDLALAEAYFQETLSIQQSIEDRVGIAESLNSLANLAHERGDLEGARSFYERSLSLQQTAMPYRADVVLHNLGVVAQEQGELTEARQLFQESIALKRTLDDRPGLALSLAKLGEVVSSIGDPGQAHAALSESLRLLREIGDRPGIAFVLERFAMTAAAHREPLRALRLGGAADALRVFIGVPLGAGARRSFLDSLQEARSRLAGEAADRAWADGQALPLEVAITEALAGAVRSEPAGSRDAMGHLSAREREVAILIAQGLTNRDIAEKLVVSERTAENHVQRVLNRLGLRSRAQVAAWVVRQGLET